MKYLNRQIRHLRHFLNETIFWKGLSFILFAVFVFSQLFDVSILSKFPYIKEKRSTSTNQANITLSPSADNTTDIQSLINSVLPTSGVTLPISWGDLGKKMIADGVIDEAKFRALFEEGLNDDENQMLSGDMNQPVILTEQNSRYLLDILWAFGLANKNDILDNGEMTDVRYDGAGNFASTGGWTLSKGAGFDHYSMHQYVTLSAEQQALVDQISRNIYRPCCGNSTHFPDCNHGMAMLGLLELMAKNGVNEQEMYSVALKVNSFWFPQTYLDLATYFGEQGTTWDQVDAKTVLGIQYSSAQGYQQTRQNIKSLPKPQQGGGSCGA